MLNAEAGTHLFSCLENQSPSVFVAAHHPGHRGVIPPGGVISILGVNDRGVTHAGAPLTTVIIFENNLNWHNRLMVPDQLDKHCNFF